MSTSAKGHRMPPMQKLILIDLVAALFLALFGAVYELFSHGVYSYFMIYAFAFPLALGALPLYLIGILHAVYPDRLSRSVYHAGIATLTAGSLVSGVLEIYGTGNPLTAVYWVAGILLVILGAVLYVAYRIRSREPDDDGMFRRPGRR